VYTYTVPGELSAFRRLPSARSSRLRSCCALPCAPRVPTHRGDAIDSGHSTFTPHPSASRSPSHQPRQITKMTTNRLAPSAAAPSRNVMNRKPNRSEHRRALFRRPRSAVTLYGCWSYDQDLHATWSVLSLPIAFPIREQFATRSHHIVCVASSSDAKDKTRNFPSARRYCSGSPGRAPTKQLHLATERQGPCPQSPAFNPPNPYSPNLPTADNSLLGEC
jgi:hypothetical protein